MTHTLTVRVRNATGLKDADGMPFAGKSDPYVKLRLLDGDGEKIAPAKKTKVVENTSDPVWNEELVFSGLSHPASYLLKVNVLDKDHLVGKFADFLNKDDDLGDSEVHLGTLDDRKEYQEFSDVVVAGWIWKSKVSFDLCTGGRWGNGQDIEKKLTVRVISASGLRDAEGWFQGKNDPYVYLTLHDHNKKQVGEAKQTKVLEEAGDSAEWNEEFVWEGLQNPCALTCKLHVYEKDTLTRDDDLGDCKVYLGTLNYKDEMVAFEKLIDKKHTSKLKFEINTHGGWGNNKPVPIIEEASSGCKCC